MPIINYCWQHFLNTAFKFSDEHFRGPKANFYIRTNLRIGHSAPLASLFSAFMPILLCKSFMSIYFLSRLRPNQIIPSAHFKQSLKDLFFLAMFPILAYHYNISCSMLLKKFNIQEQSNPELYFISVFLCPRAVPTQ